MIASLADAAVQGAIGGAAFGLCYYACVRLLGGKPRE